MSSSYDIFAFDLDGTIIHNDPEKGRCLPLHLKEQIQALAKKSHILIATGRRLRSAQVIRNDLPEVEFIVCHNGLMVCDSHGNKIEQGQIDRSEASHVIQLMIRQGIAPVVVMDGHWKEVDFVVSKKSSESDEGVKLLLKRNHIHVVVTEDLELYLESLPPEHILEVASISPFSQLSELRDRLNAELPSSLRSLIVRNCGYETLSVMEVFKRDFSKWTGVERVKTEIQAQSVIAFGDDENDIEMLQNANHSVAMGHASERVKASAKEVVKDHIELARLLESFR